MTDPLEKILRPIVEGQITSFINDHPEILEGWKGKHTHKTKARAVRDSIAKRIIRDLLCAETRVRLEKVFVEAGYCDDRN